MALGMATRTSTAVRGRCAVAPRVVVSRAAVCRPAASRGAALVARAYLEYPDPQLIASVAEEFPDKGIANVEEARALLSLGWTYVDVRPALEIEEVGKYKGAVAVPLKNMVKKYNNETNTKEYFKSDNPEFVAQFKRKFPDTEAKIMIGCSDGATYSMDALMALDEAGYCNLVGMKGGYYRWYKTFDNNLRRRRGDGYTEDHTAEGGDSCGIHSSGAGFERVDKIEAWVPKKF
ncbi:hypothetical protein FOA52_007234 [Chlamydomonas sp. UWO 241]|nr:hypothetical protein FOA52_007234 [Chlamydomonas sp. UWO 241]